MKLQLKSRTCDISVVSDRMKRTFESRRGIIDGGEKLEILLELYPALKNDNQVTVVNLFIYLR